MSNEWNWHVNSLQTRLSDLQSTIDSIKSCVERRPGLDAATQAIAALVEASTQSEYALQQFPTALSTILADPAIGSILIGPNGEIVLYNAAAEQLLGREYMADRSVTSVQFSNEDRSKRLLTDELPWSRAIKGESLPDVRLHLSRPAAADTWLNVSATPFKSPDGAVTGAVVFLIDTTEEVQLEDSISTLCNTIQDQIAQVGDTHTQLRDLAERLSTTGIQRLLSDSSAPPQPGQPQEDPSRKKSEPRRDVGISPSAARQTEPPSAQDAEASRVIVTPPPSPPQAVQSTFREPEPRTELEEVVAQAETEAVLPEVQVTAAESDDQGLGRQPDLSERTLEVEIGFYDKSLDISERTLEVERGYYESQAADESPTASGTWAEVTPQAEITSAPFPENTIESSSLDVAETRKNLEKEAMQLLADPTTEISPADEAEEMPGDIPPEAEVTEKLPEFPTARTAEESAPAAEETPRWSKEYAQKYEAAPEENDTPERDFSVSAYQTTEQEGEAKPVSEGDEVVGSAKSLFGKFANLTKDSYSEGKSEEKEPDPALPWPELVDGQGYGEPLWDEYTQSEEESTPWQQDKVEETVEESPSPFAPITASVEAASPVAQDDRLPTDSGEVQFADLDSPQPADEASYEIPDGHAGSDAVEEEPVNEFAPLDQAAEAEAVGTTYDAVDSPSADVQESMAEAEAVESQSPTEVTASEYQATEEATIEEAEVSGEEAAVGYTGESVAKPSALKDSLSKGKPRASSSYNRLKPLSAAADLDDGGYLDEGLSEQVVRFSSLESSPEEEGPRRVLVVDDIPVNQKLLLLHLKRLGYEADVASNGQEALDMISEKSYELILMDCDMPVMSGFEAASRIRSNEAYSHRRIPIIALTSYDREGDREKCIAAGMDDYITKGASQKELKETIERSIVSARSKSDSDDELDSEDMAPLDIAAMLKLYGQEEVEEISRLFLSNMGTYIECMQLAIDNKDSDSVAHFANAVKGPCAALGMRLMTRLTSDIMAYAESQDWTQVRVKYMRLKAVFVQTREELKKVCPDDSLLAT